MKILWLDLLCQSSMRLFEARDAPVKVKKDCVTHL